MALATLSAGLEFHPVIRLSVPNILSACKAEEGGDALASLTDDNAADGKIGGSDTPITGWNISTTVNIPKSAYYETAYPAV